MILVVCYKCAKDLKIVHLQTLFDFVFLCSIENNVFGIEILHIIVYIIANMYVFQVLLKLEI
jgi:hypothetical protein